MIQALHTGASGLRSQQTRMDVIANNIANTNTGGYKAVRVDFQDALYQAMRRPVESETALNLQLGHGVSVQATTRPMTRGIIQVTGRPMDLMIDSQETGFFSVMDGAGNIFYTRSGSFMLSNEPEDNYLVTNEGYYVLDKNGERIYVQEWESDFIVKPDGTIVMRDNEPYSSIGTYTFENPEGLDAVGRNLFSVNENSGEARRNDNIMVRQGSLEASNVDMAQEMTTLIRTQRAYQFSARIVSTADEMEGLANNLRR